MIEILTDINTKHWGKSLSGARQEQLCGLKDEKRIESLSFQLTLSLNWYVDKNTRKLAHDAMAHTKVTQHHATVNSTVIQIQQSEGFTHI